MRRQLTAYASRNLITPLQRRAGEMFAEDHDGSTRLLAHRDARRPPEAGGGPGWNPQAVARRRYHEVCRAVGELRHVDIAVCVDDKPARAFTDARGEPHQAAMPMLRLALDVLAVFYRVREAA